MSSTQDRTFHTLRIKNVLFTGHIGGDGPRLEALVDRHRTPQWLPLGSIAKICADAQGTWYVCKHDLRERRIALAGFGREDAVELADAFGLTIQSFDAAGDRRRDFTQSPAWEGLKTWVAGNREIAATWADHDLHVAGWYEEAISENKSTVTRTALDQLIETSAVLESAPMPNHGIASFDELDESDRRAAVAAAKAKSLDLPDKSAKPDVWRTPGAPVETGSALNQSIETRALTTEIVSGCVPDHLLAPFDKLDGADYATMLQAEIALDGIAERLTAANLKSVGLLRELLKPDIWRALLLSKELKQIMGKVNPDIDPVRREREVFALVLTGDGVEDIKSIELVESFEDACDTLYRVASEVHAVRQMDFAASVGLDPEDANGRRLAAVRWAADAGCWHIRRTMFFENANGKHGKEHSTIMIDDDLVAELAPKQPTP